MDAALPLVQCDNAVTPADGTAKDWAEVLDDPDGSKRFAPFECATIECHQQAKEDGIRAVLDPVVGPIPNASRWFLDRVGWNGSCFHLQPFYGEFGFEIAW